MSSKPSLESSKNNPPFVVLKPPRANCRTMHLPAERCIYLQKKKALSCRKMPFAAEKMRFPAENCGIEGNRRNHMFFRCCFALPSGRNLQGRFFFFLPQASGSFSQFSVNFSDSMSVNFSQFQSMFVHFSPFSSIFTRSHRNTGFFHRQKGGGKTTPNVLVTGFETFHEDGWRGHPCRASR